MKNKCGIKNQSFAAYCQTFYSMNCFQASKVLKVLKVYCIAKLLAYNCNKKCSNKGNLNISKKSSHKWKLFIHMS